MTLTEKAAYLKGLMDGLNTDDKVLRLMAELISDMASEIAGIRSEVEDISETVDAIDEDLGEVEKDIYITDDDGGSSFDECDYGDDDDKDEYEEVFDEEMYEVTCPTCNDTICLNAAMIEDGSMTCPNCGELLEFDLDDLDGAEEESGEE